MPNTMSRTLPDGNLAKDTNEYLSNWQSATTIIEQMLDVRVHSYDPGLSVTDNKTGKTLQLPGWFAIRLLELHTRLDTATSKLEAIMDDATTEICAVALYSAMQQHADDIHNLLAPPASRDT